MPADTKNAVATEAPVYASSTSESVTPLSTEYTMKSAAAVDGASDATRAAM